MHFTVGLMHIFANRWIFNALFKDSWGCTVVHCSIIKLQYAILNLRIFTQNTALVHSVAGGFQPVHLFCSASCTVQFAGHKFYISQCNVQRLVGAVGVIFKSSPCSTCQTMIFTLIIINTNNQQGHLGTRVCYDMWKFYIDLFSLIACYSNRDEVWSYFSFVADKSSLNWHYVVHVLLVVHWNKYWHFLWIPVQADIALDRGQCDFSFELNPTQLDHITFYFAFFQFCIGPEKMTQTNSSYAEDWIGYKQC